MPFKIALVSPKIPPNTGSIARLTAATKSELHLIEPLGFELSDRYLKRAGLDYWPYVSLKVHPTWRDFEERAGIERARVWLFTTKSSRSYLDADFRCGDSLVFGSEDVGLPDELHRLYHERRLCIPIWEPQVRSLNLANAAAIALYEALRQVRNGVTGEVSRIQGPA